MFNPFPQAIATETQKPHDSVSTEQISIPLGWIAGSALAVIVTLVSLVWWAGKLAAKVEASAESIEELEKKIENEKKEFDLKTEKEKREGREQQKELKDEIRKSFKADLIQSENTISHSLELFMLEVRSEFKKITEAIEVRNNTVNRLGRKVDYISNEMIGMAQQLQGNGIPIHYRRGYDNGAPSQPHNYDDD
jgi:Sec-independent protein translocase protein TatA